MKKLRLISLIILIPIIVGIILMVTGRYTNNKPVFSAGNLVLSAGTFLTMFILVVIALVLMMTGKLEDGNGKQEKKQPSTREEENSESDDVNPSSDQEGKENDGEIVTNRAAHIYKNSTAKEKVLGWLFFGALMTDFILIPIFAFFRIYVGSLVCFCLFVGTILVCFFINLIREKCSIEIKVKKMDKMKILCGQVKESILSNKKSVGGKKPARYKVVVTAEGKNYTAYSEYPLGVGEIVAIAVKGRRKASIANIEKMKRKVELIIEEYDRRKQEGDDKTTSE